MKKISLDIEGLLVIEPDVFGDNRGFFLESYNKDKFHEIGISDDFLQDNHSKSVKNTLRGLHFQTSPGQVKLVRCVVGKIWDVVVDIRPESSTFGKWIGVELSKDNKKIFYVPVGFAHGFVVLSESAEVLYKVSSVYNPKTEAGIAWDDPDLMIDWKTDSPVLSERDKNNQSFAEYKKTLEL